MKTVMIVEDAAVIRELTEAVLRQEGYRTIIATDGQEALRLLAGETPDLILLDLGLPVLDGRSLLARIRASERLGGVPVLVLTAAPDRDRVRDIAALGISGYMLKSEFSLAQLLQRVRMCIEGETRQPRATPAPKAAASRLGPGVASSARPDSTAPTSDNTPATGARGLRGLRPLMSRSEVLRSVEACGELRALSPAAAKVLELTQRPGCSMESLARVVAQDHAMALKLLKLANSAAFPNGDPVDSVQKAVVRIGVEGIRQCVLSLAVVDRFSAPIPGGEHSMLDFWEHAIAVATIAAELARAAGPRQAEAAFTTGLLHDVGRLIYAEQLGDRYAEVVDAAMRMEVPLERAESRLLLLSHAEVMDRVLQGWNFAKELINPIVLHHHSPAEIRSAAPRQATDALRLGLADRLAHALLLGGSGNDAIYPTEAHCRALGIDGATLEQIVSRVRSQTDELKLAMLAAATTAATAAPVRDRVRGRLRTALRPVYASAAPDLDAYRLLLETLADSPGEEAPPNLAVAHVTSPGERAEVAARLESLLAGVRGQAPPLIVLAPEGDLPPADTRWPQPAIATLKTPATLGQILGAINAAIAPGHASRAA